MRFWPWLWYFARWILVTWMWLRLSVRSQIPPGLRLQLPLLICAKHASSCDIPVLGHLTERLSGQIPKFQMGSFVGYRWLGPLVPLLQRLGGFCVMRPKELRRLIAAGVPKADALERMRAVNERAESTRRHVLETGGALVVFPEGTRDATALRPLKAKVELETAVAVDEQVRAVHIWPVVLYFGPPRGFRRRRLDILMIPPEPIGGRSAETLLAWIDQVFQSLWPGPRAESSPQESVEGNP